MEGSMDVDLTNLNMTEDQLRAAGMNVLALD